MWLWHSNTIQRGEHESWIKIRINTQSALWAAALSAPPHEFMTHLTAHKSSYVQGPVVWQGAHAAGEEEQHNQMRRLLCACSRRGASLPLQVRMRSLVAADARTHSPIALGHCACENGLKHAYVGRCWNRHGWLGSAL